jgi:hypothetical protein
MRTSLFSVRVAAGVFVGLAFAVCSFAESDWQREGFTAPAEDVYRIAKKVVSEHYRLESSDDKNLTLRFHIGTTAWSWGYNVNLTVESTGAGTSQASVAIEKSGGPVFSWGSGKKEIRKVWHWMHEELYQRSRKQ